MYKMKEKDIPIDLEIIKKNIKENGNPHITGTGKLFQGDPSTMLEIAQGALLRDHTQSIIKNGGDAEFKFTSLGNKKMSL